MVNSEKTYDFSGWITRFEIPCTDGRMIKEGAFQDFDGRTVPLVYNHDHDNFSSVLGNIDIEYVPGEGLYGWGSFNDNGHDAKEAVRHGDITEMSIWANHLNANGGDVYDGNIKEVSLVLKGANPGAYIDNVMVHGDLDDTQAFINCHSLIDQPYLSHGDEEYGDEEYGEGEEDMVNPEYYDGESYDIDEVIDSMSPEAQELLDMIQAESEGNLQHADMDDIDESVLESIFMEMDPVQLDAFDAILAGYEESLAHEDEDDYYDDMDSYMDAVLSEMDDEQLLAFEMMLDQAEGNLSHADIDPEAMAAVLDTMSPEAIDLINAIYEEAGFDEIEHADEDDDPLSGKAIYESMNPTQQAYFRFMVGQALMRDE